MEGRDLDTFIVTDLVLGKLMRRVNYKILELHIDSLR